MGILRIDQITYREDGNLVLEDKSVEIPRRLEIPQINDRDFKERLEEINETYQVIRDPKTGRAFEIAIVNESRLKYGAVLMPSTMFSSLTQNPGNAIEFAAHGAATPNTARVYLAFPGNGGSDSLSRHDRQHLAGTGRFTQAGKALDSIEALARALGDKGKDIPIMGISANTEGGRLGLGIMAALPPDTVTSAYFNNLPGISPLVHASYITIMMREDRKDQQKRLNDDRNELYRVNDRTIQEAKTCLSKIYRDREYKTFLLSTWLHALPNMIAYIRAFSQHDDLQVPQFHAVLQDTLTALQRQKQAKITFQFGRLSQLHSIMECRKFGQKITEELGKTPKQDNIQLFIYADGSLDFHTIEPSKRWAAEKDALLIQ